MGDEAAARVLPYTFLNFPMRYTAEQARKMDQMMHPIVDVGLHPKSMYIGIFLLDKPDLDRPETWVFYILATWPKEDQGNGEADEQNMVDELRRRAEDWADPFKSAVEWVPKDVKAKAVPFKIWAPPSNWNNHRGRITLAGDAAHSMTFRKMNSLSQDHRPLTSSRPRPRSQQCDQRQRHVRCGNVQGQVRGEVTGRCGGRI